MVATRVSGVVINAPDAVALAEFYAQLLGWRVVDRAGPNVPGRHPRDSWALVRPPEGGPNTKLEFQSEIDFERPVWPSEAGQQQMLHHLDIAVEDLDAGVAWAIECGATVAEHQPQRGVRVMLDPAGHPFCLFPGAV
jgi:catechol 2,3-dioxygenase-like lactoylglutathione lyase family enzyme